jgi:hypothetical protein
MARKTLTPLQEGEHITATRVNDLFNSNGVAGIVSDVAGDQVAQGGITARACNTAIRGVSTAARGTGNPWFGGEALPGGGINNLTIVQPGQVITGTGDTFLRWGGNDLAVDLSNEVSDAENGDFVLVELSGQAHFFHYLSGGTYNDVNGVIPGATPTYTNATGRIYLQVTTGTPGLTQVTVPHASIPGNDAIFGTQIINGAYTNAYSTGRICPTLAGSPYGNEDDIWNTGPGTFRSFHISCIVPLNGNESTLIIKAKCNPGPAIAGSPAPFADPTAHILQASFTGRVIRKGEKF